MPARGLAPRARIRHFARICPLVIVYCGRERHEQRRQSRGCNFGHSQRTRSAYAQVRPPVCRRHIFNEWHDVYVEFAAGVCVNRGLQRALTGLMPDDRPQVFG